MNEVDPQIVISLLRQQVSDLQYQLVLFQAREVERHNAQVEPDTVTPVTGE